MAQVSTRQLFEAISDNNLQEVKQIVDEIGPDHLDGSGRSAVFYATELQNGEILELLLESGADIDLQDPDKKLTERTAFLLAGSEGLDEMLQILLKYNPNVNLVNYYGGNALIPAAHHGHVSTVKLLLEQSDCDINLINNLGWTAMLETVILSDGGSDHQEILQLLLDHGADAQIADRDGKTPLDHAKSKGYSEMVKILEDHSI